jgi:hypothetical protein
MGDRCDSKKVCQEHLHCSKGACQECSVRPSIQPVSKRKWANPHEAPPEDTSIKIIANDINASCYSDSITNIFALSARQSTLNHPICRFPSTPPRGNPCEKAAHCDADHYCDWGLCKKCTSSDACLGAKCRSNNKCKTGFCNNFGRCDYPGQKKIISGPGRTGIKQKRIPGVPKGHERGPAKVRDEAMRVEIPGQKVMETGRAYATA